MSSDSIVFVGLMPHAPLLVRGVGGDRHAHVGRTIRAMTNVARHAVAAQPDAVVVISPCSPRRPGAFGVWETPLLHGSFEHFGSDENHIDLPLDRLFVERLAHEATARGIRLWKIGGPALDHGATVPLSYLISAGWKGPTVVVGLNQPGDDQLEEFGHTIAEAANALRFRLALIASGDMSHRLTATAPSGYHADGTRFDQTFIELLRSGSLHDIGQLDPAVVAHADEDVLAPTRIALAAVDYTAPGRTVLSYEGPFGVGYGVAILAERQVRDPASAAIPATATPIVLSHRADLPWVARCAVAAVFQNGPDAPPFEAAGDLAQPQALFVTLRRVDHELRGSSGSPTPTQKDLVWQTWHDAREAAFRDSRFHALRVEELLHVRFSVSLLGPLETISSPAQLNPALYGLLVSSSAGRQGLLLPGIKSVDSPAEQLRLARHRAGVKASESVKLQRFTSQTFQEPLVFGDSD